MDRLRRLPTACALGARYPVARGLRARLLGLAMLDRGDALPGLLIPRCRSVHTFGMRFPLDIHFLDRSGDELAVNNAVPPRRLVRHPRANTILEVPSR